MQRKNFRSLGLALLGVALLGTAACEDDPQIIAPAPELIVTAAPSAIDLRVGESAPIIVNVTGGILGGANVVTYQSSNARVATVSSTGLVTGVSEGNATIIVTATRTLGNNVETRTTAVPVRVQALPVAPREAIRINLTPATASVPVNGTTTFVANVERDNAPAGSTATVAFRLTDTTTATIVSQNGNVVTVRGRNPGTASIIATATSSTGATITASAASQITVTAVTPPPGQGTFTVTPNQATLNVGQTVALVTSEPARFRSADDSVATVGANGVVTARRTGTAVITAISTADSTRRANVTITVQPAGGSVAFTVAPEQAQLPQLAVNQTLRLAPSAPATFVSLDTTIVRVDTTGLVTARRAGTAVVQIRSRATGEVVSRTFTVNATAPSNAFVNIVSLTSGTTLQPINPSNVQGLVQVNLQVVPGDADSLRVLIGGQQAQGCTRTFVGNTSQQLNIVCTVNTAAFDSVTGLPTFVNQNTTIVAQLVRGGTVIAASSEQAITLNNVNSFAISARVTGPSAFDPQGILWRAGDVVATIRPVFFTGAAQTVTVTFGPNTVQAVRQTNGTFLATFPNSATAPASQSVFGETITDFVRVTAATTAAGDPVNLTNPNTNLPVFNTDQFLRVDNQAPAAGTLSTTLTPSGFIGRNFAFSSTTNFIAVADNTANTGTRQDFGGVDRVRIVFFQGPANLTGAQIVARGDSLTSAAGLAATQTNTALRLVALACDALNNCSRADVDAVGNAVLFGVDPFDPVINASAVPNQFIANNPTDTARVFTVTVIDTAGGSGIDLNAALQVRIIRQTPGGTVCFAPSVRQSDGSCSFASTNNTIPVPNDFGYYDIDFRAVDRAGNVSGVVERDFLVDLEAPRVINIILPVSFQAGTRTEFIADVADNLDLFTERAKLFFPIPGTAVNLALPFNNPTVLSAPFDATLLTAATVRDTLPLVVSLTYETGVTGAGRATTSLTAVGFEVFDAARNVGSAERVLTGFNTTTDPFAGFTFTASVDPTTVSTTTTAARSATLTATLRGAQGVANPFQTVYFYRAISTPAGSTAELVGVARTASIIDQTVGGAAVRDFTYTTTVNAADLPLGSNTLYAVGVNASGNGFHSTNATLTRQ